MSKGKYEEPFHLDLPFGEALERYAQTEPRELPEPKKKKKKSGKPAENNVGAQGSLSSGQT